MPLIVSKAHDRVNVDKDRHLDKTNNVALCQQPCQIEKQEHPFRPPSLVGKGEQSYSPLKSRRGAGERSQQAHKLIQNPKIAMQPLRRRINPKNFVITLRQIAKHLKISQERILNWEKWHNVLWVNIKGLGGYFVSYRKLEQWITVCRSLISFCPDLQALNALWLVILQEGERYTKQALSQLEAIWQQRHAYLSNLFR